MAAKGVKSMITFASGPARPPLRPRTPTHTQAHTRALRAHPRVRQSGHCSTSSTDEAACACWPWCRPQHTALATFGDGSTALARTDVGSKGGRAYYAAFLPGLAYFDSAIPLRPVDRASVDEGMNHFIPTCVKLYSHLTIILQEEQEINQQHHQHHHWCDHTGAGDFSSSASRLKL